MYDPGVRVWAGYSLYRHINTKSEASESAASVAASATYSLTNYGATTEPGEPRFNGKMNRTIWGEFTPDTNSRVVIHTFGSDFDTALAVHTGNKVNKLKKVEFNDNFKVAGLATVEQTEPCSVRRQEGHQIQRPVRQQDECRRGLFANVFVFPKSGQLSAFLAQVSGNTVWGGREYNCGFGTTEPLPCDDATFLLHNSTDKTVKVFASSDLGPGFTAPGPITLKPGKAALATFTFDNANFDMTTVRTVAGGFLFEAKRGGTVISRAGACAVVVVKDGAASPDVLRAAKIAPTMQSDWINAPNEFTVTPKNTGSVVAKNCHARAERYEFLRAIWQRLKSGKPVGGPNKPFNIPAGQSQTFCLTSGSMEYRVADPAYPANIAIDCANTAQASLNLKNTFDVSAVGNWQTATLATRILSPKGDKLKVPAGGQAIFKASAKSTGANGTIVVRPRNTVRRSCGHVLNGGRLPVEEQKRRLHGVAGIQYAIRRKVTRYFKVFVDATANDPGFAPTQRRVFLEFLSKRPAAVTDGFSEIPVAAESIAPKMY